MTMNAILAAVALLLAFMVGFAMKHGGLCTYAAAVQMVRERRLERLMAFLAAAAFAALLVVPASLLWPHLVRPGGTHGQWAMVLLGGLLLGAGAWLNRGCVFGTFVQLTGGNLNYVATLAGMVAGALGTRLLWPDAAPVKTLATPLQASLQTTGLLAGLWLLLAVIVIWAQARRLRRQAARAQAQGTGNGHGRPAWLEPMLVALVLGAGGGWLFATVNGWDFAAVLIRQARLASGLAKSGPTLLAVGCALLMTAGGIAAAVWRERFRLVRPDGRGLLARFGGGGLMGMASVLLPDGNDGLLLSGIPALAPHALAGFALMVASMLALLAWLPNDGGYSINRAAARQAGAGAERKDGGRDGRRRNDSPAARA